MDKATLTNAFVPGPVLENLLDYTSIADLRSLQLTCRHFKGLYEYALPTRYNIHRTLSRWLPKPSEFLEHLDECNAIVSGSAALRFFDYAAEWEPDDMDIYLPRWSSRKMHDHLTNVQGCKFTKLQTAEEARYPVNDIDSVRTYSRRHPQTGVVEHVQVIVVLSSDGRMARRRGIEDKDLPVQAILDGFHSTTVLNYITGTEAISLYPSITFGRKRRMYLKKPWTAYPELSFKRALEKYIARGWPVHDVGPTEQSKRMSPMRKARHIGDQYCWRIAFDSLGRGRRPAALQQTMGFTNPVGSLWWTMDVIRQHSWRELEPWSEQTPRVVSLTKLHDYPITTHGRLQPDQEPWYRVLARLPATAGVHEYPLFHPSPSFLAPPLAFCACWEGGSAQAGWSAGPGGYACEMMRVEQAEAGEKEKKEWSVEQARGVWSAMTVGSCAPVEAMEWMAQRDDVHEQCSVVA
jgi:hypothetical protein